MAKTEEGGRDRVAIDYSTDLLKTLVSRKCLPAKEDIELSLGLSSNGRFGVDPKVAILSRSSSIPGFNIGNGDEEAVIRNGFSSASSLVRACSLPVETAEEWRKRKEMQSLSRMEAKRKRSEKQGSLMGVRDQTGDNGGGDRIDGKNGFSGIGIWGLDCDSAGAGGGFGWNRSDKLPPLPPPPKACVGSQGSGSFAISEAGNNASGEALSHSSNQPSPESDQKHPVEPERGVEIAGVGRVSQNMAKELTVFVDMPCVSTKGEGPNGKRVEGFLYRYRKVDEVRIVCVCHGQFFSPAEFVRHAGGREVAHPLKHIVVAPMKSPNHH